MKQFAKDCYMEDYAVTSGSQTDLRVVKTLGLIKASFLKLVSEMRYDDLTVSALCRYAKIGRKTFYTYYHSLDDLFGEVLEDIVHEYLDSIKEYMLPDHMEEITRKFYVFSANAGKFYENLVCSDSYQVIGTRMIRKFVKGTWAKAEWSRPLTDVEQEILLCFIYNSGLGLYRQWVMSGKTIPVEKMIALATTLLGKGVEGFKNDLGPPA